jgi:hypothetical protein
MEIPKCKSCKNKKACNFWSSDGWDRMEDWVCELMDDKKIAGAIEWHEENKIETPNWCPLLPKVEKRKRKLKNLMKD